MAEDDNEGVGGVQDSNSQTERSAMNQSAEVIQLGPPRPERITPIYKMMPVLWRPLRQWICWRWTCPAFVESVFDFTLPALRTEAG